MAFESYWSKWFSHDLTGASQILQKSCGDFELFNNIWKVAVDAQNLDAIRFIIDCPIEYPYPTSFNIIHYASNNNKKKVVNYLLQTENFTLDQKMHLLHRAIRHYRNIEAGGGFYLIKELIKQGIVLDERRIIFQLEPLLGTMEQDTKIVNYYKNCPTVTNTVIDIKSLI
jgi:hypothetical protein